MPYDPEFDFNNAIQKIGLAMPVLATVELDKITATVEMTHTIGPFLDPTKYRDALQKGDMDSIARLAQTLIPAVKIWNEEIAPKLEKI